MYDYALKKMSRSQLGSKLLVFTFHNIIEEGDKSGFVGISSKTFERQLSWITEHFEVLPLREAINRCQNGELQEAAACLTFDDGYRSQKTVASRLMLRFGVSGSFFVTTGHLGKSVLWNDLLNLFSRTADSSAWMALERELETLVPGSGTNLRKLPQVELDRLIKYLTIEQRQQIIEVLTRVVDIKHLRTLMMEESEVRELFDTGFEVGGHTLMHPILTLESKADARQQIGADLANIRRITGADVGCFAFPNGMPGKDYDASHLDILASEKIDIALTSAFGHFNPSLDRLQVPRVSLQGESALGFMRTVRSAYRTSNIPIIRRKLS